MTAKFILTGMGGGGLRDWYDRSGVLRAETGGTVDLDYQNRHRIAAQHGGSWIAAITAPAGAGPPPQTLHLVPSPEFASAGIIAVLGGYRARLRRGTSLDVALFRNRYRRLRSAAFGEAAP